MLSKSELSSVQAQCSRAALRLRHYMGCTLKKKAARLELSSASLQLFCIHTKHKQLSPRCRRGAGTEGACKVGVRQLGWAPTVLALIFGMSHHTKPYHAHKPLLVAERDPINSCPWRDSSSGWSSAWILAPLPCLGTGGLYASMRAFWPQPASSSMRADYHYWELFQTGFGTTGSCLPLFLQRSAPALFIKEHTTSELLTCEHAVQPTNYSPW